MRSIEGEGDRVGTVQAQIKQQVERADPITLTRSYAATSPAKRERFCACAM